MQQAGTIENGRVIEGNGSIERKNWVSEAEQPRGYTVNFPVTHLGWRALTVRFTPAGNGTVTLTLMGPFEEASKGVVYRQEVLWDDVRVEGAALEDGGFESRQGERADRLAKRRWNRGRSVDDCTGCRGNALCPHMAQRDALHHLQRDRRPAVTIRLHARAVRVNGLRDMKPIAGRSTAAHLAARRFLRGANLGNGLEAPPGQDWGVHYSPDDLRIMRREGFDHVRIPVGWHHYTGPGPSSESAPKSSPVPMNWSMPGCARVWA